MCSIAFCRIFTPLVKDAPQRAKGHKADIEGRWLLFFSEDSSQGLKWKSKETWSGRQEQDLFLLSKFLSRLLIHQCVEQASCCVRTIHYWCHTLCFQSCLSGDGWWTFFANNLKNEKEPNKNKNSEIHPDFRRLAPQSTWHVFLAPKVLLEYLWPMITIQSHPTHPSIHPSPHIALKTTSHKKDDPGWPKAIKIFWSIELNDLWSKKISRPKMIVWSGATIILRWFCFC